MTSNRRFFAVRAAIARKAAANAANDDTTIVFAGRTLPTTDTNRAEVERLCTQDAERAYEDAAFGRETRASIAA